jgi:hypothetical protein
VAPCRITISGSIQPSLAVPRAIYRQLSPNFDLTDTERSFENVFLERLFALPGKLKILSDSQFVFRPGKSTIDAVTALVDLVVEGLENNQQTLSIFIDLSKTADCVEHPVSLDRLECCGVLGTPLNWLSSYLNDRN